nr:MAG TPA: ChiA1-BD-binding domain protein [Caudoviricetes sp.]
MSVKNGKGGNSAEIKQELAATNELMALSFQAQIKTDRAAGTNIITDDLILKSTELIKYPEWKEGTTYTVGDIITSNGLFYEVKANHTSNAAYPVETTFAYYRLIELTHAGTIDDPIPYPETAGIVVNVESGKYYSYKGAVYLAKADMPNCVYPPDTAGMWQWEVVA